MRTLFLTTAAFAALVMIAPIGGAHAGATLRPCGTPCFSDPAANGQCEARCNTPEMARGYLPAHPRQAARRQRMIDREALRQW